MPKMGVRITAVLAALILTAAACGGSDASQTTPTLSDTPTGISGTALPVFDSTSADPAIETLAPVVTGTDILSGDALSTRDSAAAGRPLMVGFYAHWCPHCQSEVPEVVAGLKQNPLPEGVDFVGISTFENATRGNYPPDAWFRREGWEFPVIADTRGSAVSEVFGVESVPFLVLIDADGFVAARVPGQLGPNQLLLLATQLAENSGNISATEGGSRSSGN